MAQIILLGGWRGPSLEGSKKGGECFYGMGHTSPRYLGKLGIRPELVEGRKADMIDTRPV
jgi:hypothetical protein